MIIFDYSLEELENLLLTLGEKKYRAKQIFEWLYKKKATSYSEMTNLSKDLISKLEEMVPFNYLEMLDKKTSVDGTCKYVWRLADGNTIESVLMRYDWGNSICISTQVGCNMSCSFCASGINKKIRNLSSGEIILQILSVEQEANLRISNVVIMGIGEPFENFDNTVKAIKMMINPKALEIAQRKITVSTSGLVHKIREFADLDTQVNLAISLHAPNNELRSKIMPVNKAYNIHELIDAVRYYIEKTNRRVTFEYIMLQGVNDNIHDAHELSDLIRGLNCYVNLIMYNEVKEFDYKRSEKSRIMAFYDTLKKRGINVTIREERGLDIYAACGQLRRMVNGEGSNN